MTNAPSSANDCSTLYPLFVWSRLSEVRKVVQNGLRLREVLPYKKARATPDCIKRKDVEGVIGALREIIHGEVETEMATRGKIEGLQSDWEPSKDVFILGLKRAGSLI